MKKGAVNPNRLGVFGDAMMGKLSSASRKRRKRSASKKRRQRLRNLERG